MKELFKKLKINKITPDLELSYKKAVDEKEVPYWLTHEFLDSVNNENEFITRFLPELHLALDEILKDDDLLLYAKVVYRMLLIDKPIAEVLGNITLPTVPEDVKNTVGYDLFGFFPMLPLIVDAYKELKLRGVDEEILNNTYMGIDGIIKSGMERAGKLCVLPMYFNWNYLYAKGYLLSVGRLNFEILPMGRKEYGYVVFKNKNDDVKILIDGVKLHKSGNVLGSYLAEDEDGSYFAEVTESESSYIGYAINDKTELVETTKTELKKSEWIKVLDNTDAVLSVHIPASGKLDGEECEKSYKKAIELFTKYFPEYNIKGFLCESWLLAPELKKLLKPESNILKFKSKYNCFPVSAACNDVFGFVFKKGIGDLKNFNYDELPETNSFTHNIKELYKNGEAIHETGGIILV